MAADHFYGGFYDCDIYLLKAQAHIISMAMDAKNFYKMQTT